MGSGIESRSGTQVTDWTQATGFTSLNLRFLRRARAETVGQASEVGPCPADPIAEFQELRL